MGGLRMCYACVCEISCCCAKEGGRGIVTFFFGHVLLFGVVELRFILFEEGHLDVVDLYGGRPGGRAARWKGKRKRSCCAL